MAVTDLPKSPIARPMARRVEVMAACSLTALLVHREIADTRPEYSIHKLLFLLLSLLKNTNEHLQRRPRQRRSPKPLLVSFAATVFFLLHAGQLVFY